MYIRQTPTPNRATTLTYETHDACGLHPLQLRYCNPIRARARLGSSSDSARHDSTDQGRYILRQLRYEYDRTRVFLGTGYADTLFDIPTPLILRGPRQLMFTNGFFTLSYSGFCSRIVYGQNPEKDGIEKLAGQD